MALRDLLKKFTNRLVKARGKPKEVAGKPAPAPVAAPMSIPATDATGKPVPEFKEHERQQYTKKLRVLEDIPYETRTDAEKEEVRQLRNLDSEYQVKRGQRYKDIREKFEKEQRAKAEKAGLQPRRAGDAVAEKHGLEPLVPARDARRARTREAREFAKMQERSDKKLAYERSLQTMQFESTYEKHKMIMKHGFNLEIVGEKDKLAVARAETKLKLRHENEAVTILALNPELYPPHAAKIIRQAQENVRKWQNGTGTVTPDIIAKTVESAQEEAILDRTQTKEQKAELEKTVAAKEKKEIAREKLEKTRAQDMVKDAKAELDDAKSIVKDMKSDLKVWWADQASEEPKIKGVSVDRYEGLENELKEAEDEVKRARIKWNHERKKLRNVGRDPEPVDPTLQTSPETRRSLEKMTPDASQLILDPETDYLKKHRYI